MLMLFITIFVSGISTTTTGCSTHSDCNSTGCPTHSDCNLPQRPITESSLKCCQLLDPPKCLTNKEYLLKCSRASHLRKSTPSTTNESTVVKNTTIEIPGTLPGNGTLEMPGNGTNGSRDKDRMLWIRLVGKAVSSVLISVVVGLVVRCLKKRKERIAAQREMDEIGSNVQPSLLEYRYPIGIIIDRDFKDKLSEGGDVVSQNSTQGGGVSGFVWGPVSADFRSEAPPSCETQPSTDFTTPTTYWQITK